jgi:hypothetical protein
MSDDKSIFLCNIISCLSRALAANWWMRKTRSPLVDQGAFFRAVSTLLVRVAAPDSLCASEYIKYLKELAKKNSPLHQVIDSCVALMRLSCVAMRIQS